MHLFHSLALSSALVLAAPGAFADVHDHFNSALAALPAAVFETETPANFVNLHAMIVVFGVPELIPDHAQRGLVALDLPVYRAALAAPKAEFRAKSGIEAFDLNFLASYGFSPDQGVVWGFDTSASATLAAALPGLGFTEIAGNTFQIGELGGFNPAGSDPANPWLGEVGNGSLVYPEDGRLVQAFSAEALTAMGAEPTLFDTKAGRALAQAYGAGPDLVTEAVFFSTAFVERSAGRAEGGLPPFMAGMIADLQADTGAKAALSFVYPDCTRAAAAAAVLQDWPIETAGVAEVATRETDHGCLATAVLSNSGEAKARNPAFWSLYALINGQMPPIGLAAE